MKSHKSPFCASGKNKIAFSCASGSGWMLFFYLQQGYSFKNFKVLGVVSAGYFSLKNTNKKK